MLSRSPVENDVREAILHFQYLLETLSSTPVEALLLVESDHAGGLVQNRHSKTAAVSSSAAVPESSILPQTSIPMPIPMSMSMSMSAHPMAPDSATRVTMPASSHLSPRVVPMVDARFVSRSNHSMPTTTAIDSDNTNSNTNNNTNDVSLIPVPVPAADATIIAASTEVSHHQSTNRSTTTDVAEIHTTSSHGDVNGDVDTVLEPQFICTTDEVLYNLALCHYVLKEYEAARYYCTCTY